MQLAGAAEHEIALEILKRPSKERLNDEISVLVKWLRKLSKNEARQGRVTVLGEIQDEVLREIVRHCQLASFQPNQVLIKQGNVGDSMYIILTGMCDIRIGGANTAEEEEGGESQFEEGEVLKLKPQAIEGLLGVSVGTFRAGHAFGEVALVNSVPRTANVIVNPESEICQVLVINKDLFEHTLQDYMRREEAEKSEFIEQFAHFADWPHKFRQQLLRSFSKTRFLYDEVVMRQGEEIEAVYFITSGEVKLTMAPGLHRKQFSRQLGEQVTADVFGAENRLLNERREQQLQLAQQRCQWCCLMRNEIIGCPELLLNLRNYISTGCVTLEANMLRLSLREWNRLVERRHPHTLLALKEDVLMRLSQRTLLPLTSEAPLLGHALGSLYSQIREQDRMAQRRQRRRQAPDAGDFSGGQLSGLVGAGGGGSRGRSLKLQLPKVGPLIDLWGPGTVFDYINRRFRQQELRRARAAAISGTPQQLQQQKSSKQQSHLQLQERRQSQRELQQLQRQQEAAQYSDRCKLLQVLAHGFHDTRPQLGRPFLAREQLELVGIEKLEASVSHFCQQLRQPGERVVAVPSLRRPDLPEPPKEPRVAVLRPLTRSHSRRRQRKQLVSATGTAADNAGYCLLPPWRPDAY